MSTALFTLKTEAATTTLLLIRHGETDENASERCMGHRDIPLNDKGHLQAQMVAEKLKKLYPDLSAIYSSDLSRAQQTASKTAGFFGLEVVPLFELRERFYGEAEGATKQERAERYGEKEREMTKAHPELTIEWDFTAVPGAETYQQVLDRALPALQEIAEKHPGETVAIFSHSRTIRLIIAASRGIRQDVEGVHNCDIVKFLYCKEETPSLQFLQIDSLRQSS